MTTPARAMVMLALAAGLFLPACALTSKSTPIVVRYFTPGHASPHRAGPAFAGPASSAASAPPELRLGRVSAASYLNEKIAFRDSDHEVGYYATLRWTERPEDYLRRALARALFQEHELRELVSGAGPALELELSAFEEVKTPTHIARVEVTWKVRDGRTVVAQRTLTIERAIAGAGPAGHAVAAAMGEALDRAVDAVVTAVVSELSLGGGSPDMAVGAASTR